MYYKKTIYDNFLFHCTIWHQEAREESNSISHGRWLNCILPWICHYLQRIHPSKFYIHISHEQFLRIGNQSNNVSGSYQRLLVSLSNGNSKATIMTWVNLWPNFTHVLVILSNYFPLTQFAIYGYQDNHIRLHNL